MNKLKERLDAAGITVHDLSMRWKISNKNVYQKLAGKRAWTLEQAYDLKVLLHLTDAEYMDLVVDSVHSDNV